MHGPDLSLPITNPVLIFALVLLIILVLPLIFQRFRVPGIVGLILAGVVIGPHAFGLLARDQTIELLGTVGLLYIMFMAGLEVDLNEFGKQRNRSIIFGFFTFALPQGVGALMGRYLLGFDWPGAVLLGAVFASHTLLAYPIISKLGLSKGPAVTTAVGATIITDTAALLVLAVIVRMTEGALTPLFWLQTGGLLAVFVTAVIWGVPRLGHWFFTRVRSDGVSEFVFVLAVVFTSAVMAEFVGVESIIGAFLAGLALNRLVPEHSTLMNRTQFVGDSLFIPFFLISVGMLVDVRILVAGTGAWIVAGSMLTTLIATKWLAAMSTIPLFKYSSDQAWMMFGLTVPQAAATLATVLIGYNVGIFGDAVLNGTILMILVTCMLGPWVAESYGRKVAVQRDAEPYEPAGAPQRIGIPLANPETAPMLMDLALMIRSATSEEPIFPMAVVQDVVDPQPGVAAAEKLLGHAVVHGAAADVRVIPVVRIDRNVSHGVMRAVNERMLSTIIMGWYGETSARHVIFGSVLDQLLAESRQLVIVSKIERPLNTDERILLAVPPFASLEPGFKEALQTMKHLAGQLGASIVVLGTERSVGAANEALERIKPEVPLSGIPLEDWSAIVRRLDETVLPTDLLFLIGAREGTIAWRPALNRLPRVLARRFNRNTVLIGYSALTSEPRRAVLDTGAPTGTQTEISRLLAPGRVRLMLHATDAAEAIAALLNDPESPHTRHIRKRLMTLDPEALPELAPGVVLFHTHAPGVERPELYIGINRDGLHLTRTAGLTHVVLALVSPAGKPPEEHLRLLSYVAGLFRKTETLSRLMEAETESQVLVVLTEEGVE